MAQKRSTGKTNKSRGSGRNTSRSTTRNSTRGGASKGSSGGNGGGLMILAKSFLFVLIIATVFGVMSWGLEKLGERKNGTSETKPTAGASNPDGKTTPGEGKKPTDGPGPTDSPTPTPTSDEKAMSVLKKVSRSKLGLDKEISEYKTETDDWTTYVRGKECFCVNVLNPEGGLKAVFFVAVDGSEIFRERDDGDFDSIKP